MSHISALPPCSWSTVGLTCASASSSHDLVRVGFRQQQVALDLHLLQRRPLGCQRVQLRHRNREHLLVPVTLEVVRIVAPMREQNCQGRLRRLARRTWNREVLEQGQDGVRLLMQEVGERQDEALWVAECQP